MCPELVAETADLAELCLSSHIHCQETPVLALSTAILALGSALTRVPELWSCQMGQGPESVLCQPFCMAAVPSTGHHLQLWGQREGLRAAGSQSSEAGKRYQCTSLKFWESGGDGLGSALTSPLLCSNM